jgi:hypothetical protein
VVPAWALAIPKIGTTKDASKPARTKRRTRPFFISTPISGAFINYSLTEGHLENTPIIGVDFMRQPQRDSQMNGHTLEREANAQL